MASIRMFLSALILAQAAAGIKAAPAISPCSGLTPEQKAQVQRVFDRLHPYDGCDGTFTECLKEAPPKRIVVRLANDLCRRVKDGKDPAEVERGLANRARSVIPMGRPVVLALDPAKRVGAVRAPVTIVSFACARCPFCTVVLPALHRAVTEGRLKGKACLYYEHFPIKDHPFSIEGGLALESAARLGRFWPFLLEVYRQYGSFCPKLLPSWAEAAGMERAAFEAGYSKPSAREALVADKKEGLKHKVASTPTLFINGHKYEYELGEEAIVDVVEEIYENLAVSP